MNRHVIEGTANFSKTETFFFNLLSEYFTESHQSQCKQNQFTIQLLVKKTR